MKLRGKFTADGSFIAEGEENFNPELLAEKLVEISIEVIPSVDTNTFKTAKKISAQQGVPLEVAVDALATYGKFCKTQGSKQA